MESTGGTLLRLNSDGSVDTGFLNGLSGASSTNEDHFVSAIALQADGKVLLTGRFSSVNGLEHNNIARLNPDGTLDQGFLHGMPGVSGGYYYGTKVSSFCLQPDGKVLIVGNFTVV